MKGRNDLIDSLVAILDGPEKKLSIFQSTASMPQNSQHNTQLETETRKASSSQDGPHNELDRQLLSIMKEESLAQEKENDKDENIPRAPKGIEKQKCVTNSEKARAVGDAGRFTKGANHKRASDDLNFDTSKERQPSHRGRNTTAELAASDPFAPLDDHFQRSTHLPTPEPNAQHEVEHAAMSGKSPGRPRKHHSTSKTPNSPDSLADELRSSPTLLEGVLEVPDSQESYVGLSL